MVTIIENTEENINQKDLIKGMLDHQIIMDINGKLSAHELIDEAVKALLEDDVHGSRINESYVRSYITKIVNAVVEVTEQGGLMNFNIRECAICAECGTVMLPDDECYEDYNGQALCDNCSILCEGCDKYYTRKEGSNISGVFTCNDCKPKFFKDIILSMNTIGKLVETTAMLNLTTGEVENIILVDDLDFEDFDDISIFVKHGILTKAYEAYIGENGVVQISEEELQEVIEYESIKEKITVVGYWKDSNETFEKNAVICFDHMTELEDEKVFYYFESKDSIVGDHGDFIITSFSLSEESAGNEKNMVSCNTKECFIESVEHDLDFGNDTIEIPFGSNKTAFIWEDKTVLYNTHNEEQMRFKNVEDFASWYYNDDETVAFDYQIALGYVENDVEVFYREELKNLEQDEEEDGSQLWSAFITIKESERKNATFAENKKYYTRNCVYYDCYRWYADALTYIENRQIDIVPIQVIVDTEDSVIVEVILQDEFDINKLKKHMQNYYNEQLSTYPENVDEDEIKDAKNELDNIITAMKQAQDDGFDYITLEAE